MEQDLKATADEIITRVITSAEQIYQTQQAAEGLIVVAKIIVLSADETSRFVVSAHKMIGVANTVERDHNVPHEESCKVLQDVQASSGEQLKEGEESSGLLSSQDVQSAQCLTTDAEAGDGVSSLFVLEHVKEGSDNRPVESDETPSSGMSNLNRHSVGVETEEILKSEVEQTMEEAPQSPKLEAQEREGEKVVPQRRRTFRAQISHFFRCILGALRKVRPTVEDMNQEDATDKRDQADVRCHARGWRRFICMA
ncbi:uncharacterized protein [Ambystoma mexicanum]|uniref:uncharacterized protein n=1 Tax=Ambystoma mexicanum TaxID=8296 RepID=UPI0037E7A4EB